MKLLDIKGRLRNKNVSKYLINWDGKSRSNIQFTVKQFLKPYWFGCLCYEEFPVYSTLLKVDILNTTYKIAVEVNGTQHHAFNPHFHNNNKFNWLQSMRRDIRKAEWLELNGFKLVEIEQHEVKLISKEFFKEKFDVTL